MNKLTELDAIDLSDMQSYASLMAVLRKGVSAVLAARVQSSLEERIGYFRSGNLEHYQKLVSKLARMSEFVREELLEIVSKVLLINEELIIKAHQIHSENPKLYPAIRAHLGSNEPSQNQFEEVASFCKEKREKMSSLLAKVPESQLEEAETDFKIKIADEVFLKFGLLPLEQRNYNLLLV